MRSLRTRKRVPSFVPLCSPQCKHVKHIKHIASTPTANQSAASSGPSHILAVIALMFSRSSAVFTRSLRESQSAVTQTTHTPLTHSHVVLPFPFFKPTIKSLSFIRTHTKPSMMAPTPSSRAIVISGPSGAGKSTILKRLFDEYPDRFGFSVSHTTRNPRGSEKDGVEYHFVTKDEFNDLVEKKGFVEHATFGSNSYGTSIKAIEEIEKKGRTCILDIEMEVWIYILGKTQGEEPNTCTGRQTGRKSPHIPSTQIPVPLTTKHGHP